MNKILILIFSLSFVLLSCTNKEKKETAPLVGDYVYIDNSGCLHISRDCIQLFGLENDKNYQVNFIPTKDLMPNDMNSFCSHCVNDSAFTFLKKSLKSRGFQIKQDTIL